MDVGRRSRVSVLLLVVSLWASWHAVAERGTAEEVTFHHVHLAVGDPGAQMGDAAERLAATRAILQGHGPGVRKNGEYLVFDRGTPESTTDSTPTDAMLCYRQAAAWLVGLDLTVQPSDPGASQVLAGVSAAPVVAVAFSTPDVEATLELMGKRGVRPFERTPETARFRLPSGLVVEVVAETDKPDDHWCPMHPDVRSAGPSTCGICGMDLVPIPPPRLGEYHLDVTPEPRSGRPGVSALRFVVRDPESNEPVSALLDVHERRFHLFIVSRDLRQFLHVHPEQTDDGSFVLRQELDAGRYVLIADFLPAGGTPQMVHRAIVTPGYRGPVFGPVPRLEPAPPDVTVDGVRVRLETPSLVPLRPATLRFVLTDAASGTPVTDLEPYLGAPGHLLIVTPDLSAAFHGHPEGEPSSGPAIVFDPVLPAPGLYKIWVQFQRKGRVVTAPFVIEVPQ